MSPASRLTPAVLAATLVLAPVAALHPAVSHLSSAGFASLSIELTHPLVVGVLALALVSLLPVTGFCVAIVRAARGVTHFQTLMQNSQPACVNDMSYRRLPTDQVGVFTAGLIHPVTFVTVGAEVALGTARLRAALLHEEAHQRGQDLRWRLLLQAVGRGLSFVPGIQDLLEAEALRAECRADDYAIRAGAHRLDLFEAIVAASSSRSSPLAVGLTGSNVELRLMRLVDPALPLPRRSTRVLLGLIAMVVAPAVAAHLVVIAAATWGSSHLM